MVNGASSQGLRVVRTGAGLQASWSSRVPVSLTISGAPGNFTHEADRNLALSLSLRVDTAPSSRVVLAMGCGPLCGGQLHVTDAMRSAHGRGWTSLSIPLSCMRLAGADLTNVTTPFALTSSGTFGFSLASVKIARVSDAVSCAQVPAVTAAAAVTVHGSRVYSDRGSKKKSGVSHERKKRTVHTRSRRTHRHRR